MKKNQQKILIVEDEKDLAEIIKDKLVRNGYETLIANNGEKGLMSVRSFKPDLILLDILMPKVNGYEVLKTLHDDVVLSKIPVIIISNSGQPVDIDRALSLGARDYLVKAHFSPEEVLEKLRIYLPSLESDAAGPQGVTSDKNEDSVDEQKQNKMGKGRSILVVEDDEFLSSLAGQKLEKEGWRVFHAINGEEALKMAHENHPVVVLLDIVLPDISGFDVLEKMKKDKELSDIPVFLLSNLGQESDIARGKELGAADYMVKAHFSLGEIIARIHEVVK